ncbi:MAG: cytochrome C biogenesis protein, partial [Flavobacteriaceae bacterium]
TMLITLLSLSSALAQSNLPTQKEVDSIIFSNVVDKKHAEQFASLVIQDDQGRMKPAHTFASELLRKLSFKNDYKGLAPEQVMLSMMLYPGLWYNTEILALDKKAQNDSIRKIIGVDSDQRFVKVTDFFYESGSN